MDVQYLAEIQLYLHLVCASANDPLEDRFHH